MATFTGSSPSTFYAYSCLDLDVQSQSVDTNASVVYDRLYLKSKGGGYPTSDTARPVNFSADGRSIFSKRMTYQVSVSGAFPFASGIFVVPHTEDGSKSFGFSATASTHEGMCRLSGTMTLPTIPGAWAGSFFIET